LHTIEGNIAPLFDRLRIARSVAEPQALQNLDRAALQESVRRELTWLFNVRSPTPAGRFAEVELTAVDYGVPDFTAFSPQSGEDRQRLGKLLVRAVSAFEPRLKGVEIAVEAVNGAPQALLARLEATLVAGPLMVPLTLAIAIHGLGGADQVVEVHVLASFEPPPRPTVV
jgi:type VI secretion system protein ImpF